MAIRLIDRYPNRADPATSQYPHGKGRNKSDPTADDGTPFDEDRFNDQEAFFQGLLERAGITPSGTVDTVSASDYIDALRGSLIADNLTDLQSFPTQYAVDGFIMQTAGRSAFGDGGEGNFRWDSSDLSTEVGNDEVTAGEGDGGIYVAPASDKTGASGAWVRQAVDDVWPEWYGAKGDKVTDDSAAIQQAVNSAPAGGAVLLRKQYLVGADINVPDGRTLKGRHVYPSYYNMEDFLDDESLILLDGSPTARIQLNSNTSVVGLAILPDDRTFPADATAVAAWDGSAIAIQSEAAGVHIGHCAIGGFATGIDSIGDGTSTTDTSNIDIDHCYMDNNNCVRLDTAFDVCYVDSVHCEPALSRGLTDADGERTGFAFLLIDVSDWTKITNCFTFAYNNGFRLDNVNSCTLIGCSADYFVAFSTNTSPNGFQIVNSVAEANLVACQAAGQDTGFIVDTSAVNNVTRLTACTAWDCDTAGFDYSQGRGPAISCLARDCATGYTGGTSTIPLVGCTAQNCTTGIDNASSTYLIDGPVFVGNTTDVSGGSLPSVASAGTINIDPTFSAIKITGTTDIDTINPRGAYLGRELTLFFANSLSLLTGGNLKLSGGNNVAVDAGDVIRLFSADDGFWHQINARIDT